MVEEGHEVLLHVYDLSQGLARQLSRSFLGKAIDGIWHTGVAVYGNEYFFGGGIQHSPVGTTPYGTPLRIVKLGTTHIPKEVFEEYLSDISERYTAETYNLLQHNCNNFSNEVAQFLVGETIPSYILELPNEVMSSPMGAMILPMIQQLESTLRVGAVPQAPQFKPASAMAATSQPRTVTSASAASLASERPANDSSNDTTKSENQPLTEVISEKPKELGGEVPPAVVPSGAPETAKTESAADPLGEARSRLQEEICSEFAAIMASGTLRASEAAALATRRVMEKHGRLGAAASQS
ncbi:hypothetical protein H6P81_013021 [Aristolochia fimbriata]|uniref:PPPDE domain-containing protein n=1 Tax=Aristolochia fimbriata TaxID=158543 RepID=A0AAV7EDS0_ARIFI|nr:hypothetical protein H6P81_013021 [Aristolochia fimbriata]